MSTTKLQSLSLVKINETSRHSGQLSYSRHNSYRLKKSKKYKRIDNVVINRLKKLLKELLEQIGGKAGCITVCSEFDHILVKRGILPDHFKLTRTEEDLLFRGETIHTNQWYVEPIIIENYVIGYIYLAISEKPTARIIPELITAHSKIISKEFELTRQKKSMDQYFSLLMRKKEELEKTQEYNKNLLSITTHDISSPLNAVSGYLELMEECLQHEMDISTIQHYRSQIHSGIQDISDIINQLSEITSLKRGFKSLNFINVDINWVVNDICNKMKIEAGKSGKKIKVNTIERSAHVKADISKLKRILYNIITNGIKYTKDDGLITVSTYLEEDRVYVKIADNGIGISAENQKKIFEPFMKLSENKFDTDTSCGLGLFVSSYFAKLMNGRIELTSKPDVGSEFMLSFPRVLDMDKEKNVIFDRYK